MERPVFFAWFCGNDTRFLDICVLSYLLHYLFHVLGNIWTIFGPCPYHAIFGHIWIIFNNIWLYLVHALPAHILSYLAIFGYMCSYWTIVSIFGRIWQYLLIFGNVWLYLDMFKHILSYYVIFGYILIHVVIVCIYTYYLYIYIYSGCLLYVFILFLKTSSVNLWVEQDCHHGTAVRTDFVRRDAHGQRSNDHQAMGMLLNA